MTPEFAPSAPLLAGVSANLPYEAAPAGDEEDLGGDETEEEDLKDGAGLLDDPEALDEEDDEDEEDAEDAEDDEDGDDLDDDEFDDLDDDLVDLDDEYDDFEDKERGPGAGPND